MFKKLLYLLVLFCLGYVGFQIWKNLNDDERQAVSQSLSDVAQKGKEMLEEGAERLTGPAKDAIRDNLMTEAEARPTASPSDSKR